MANNTPSPQTPEKEHSLPETFIEKREEFYAAKSNITSELVYRDNIGVKKAVLEYMILLDYICTRIKPKLKGKYRDEVTTIQEYIVQALQDVGQGSAIPQQVIEDLDRCHETVCDAMVAYGFDQITPTVLNI